MILIPTQKLMVEIIDAPINLTPKIKSDPRNQPGNTDTPSRSRGSIDKLDTPKEHRSYRGKPNTYNRDTAINTTVDST